MENEQVMHMEASDMVREIEKEQAQAKGEENGQKEEKIEGEKESQEKIIQEEGKEENKEGEEGKQRETNEPNVSSLEEPKEKERFASRFANFARKSRELKEKDRLLKLRERELEEKGQKYEKWGKFADMELPKIRKLLEENPSALMRQIGANPDKVFTKFQEENLSGTAHLNPELLEIRELVQGLKEDNQSLKTEILNYKRQDEARKIYQKIDNAINGSGLKILPKKENASILVQARLQQKIAEEGEPEISEQRAFIEEACKDVDEMLIDEIRKYSDIDAVRSIFNPSSQKSNVTKIKSEDKAQLTNEGLTNTTQEDIAPVSDDDFRKMLADTIKQHQ